MLKERWPLILFITTLVVSAPFWHELLPDEHYDKPAPAIDGRSPQAIAVFGTDQKKNPNADAPWSIPAGPLAFDATTWVGQSSQVVGCKMEKALGQSFTPYGCEDEEADPGDPCIKRTAFYAGPRYPRAKASALHPAAMDVLLDWEGGKLREMSMRLHPYVTLAEAHRVLQLPDRFRPANPDNPDKAAATSPELGWPRASISKCGDQVCVVLTAFAHVDTSVCEQDGAPK